jgi:hypothetical protein
LIRKFGIEAVLGPNPPLGLLRRLAYVDDFGMAYQRREAARERMGDTGIWDAEHPYWSGELNRAYWLDLGIDVKETSDG